MIKVSVIVPVYNVEKYLEKCLDSLVNQTLKEIEIIVINDASPDDSRRIMEEYSKKYDTIKTVYLEKNRCLGGARNAGIELAQGEYITFVDSDDYVDTNYCEKMYNKIKESGSDFAYTAYKTVDENYNETGEKIAYPIELSGELTDNKKKGYINKGVFAWGKLYSLKLWREIGLQFPEHLRYEDAPTIPIYILHCKKSCYVEDTYYRYLIRQTSILRTRNVGHDDAQTTTLMFVDRMKKYGFYEKFIEEIEYFVVQRYYCVFLRRCVQMYDEVPYKKMEETRDKIREWFPNFEKNPYYYTFVAEDRLRISMNEISSYACEIWEKNFKDEMLNNDDFYYSLMAPFYEKNKKKIGDIVKGVNNIALWGDLKKQKAFNKFLKLNYNSIRTERLHTLEVSDEKLRQYDVIISVNPNACYAIEKKKTSTRIINLEDVLNGYIGG